MNSPFPDPHSRLVQIYSAATHWEAEAALQRLREAGIPARVVGEHLGPAIKTWQQTTPHHGVLVLESQAQEAYELLNLWLENGQRQAASKNSSPRAQPPAIPDKRQREEWEVPSEDDTHQPPRTAVVVGTGLSKLMGIVGLCVLVLGGWTSWTNSRLLNRFSQVTTAHVLDLEAAHEVRGRNDHVPSEGLPTLYAYEVEGTMYQFVRKTGRQFPREIKVRYDPQDPATMGPVGIVPPLWCLFLGGLIGGFLLLGSWQFNRAPQ